ncbi:MAG: Asp-tRNA(Asn)/Glu-tRNA(Gln) amidotransferase subunit GatC [Patescibacteria group bacterium]|jgi:aspartyl-tRNA(Asn)/glutamyl-tRNA(Gln) amidotransferase subunit C
MSLDEKEVQWVANLAKLELTDAESVQYADQLSAILGYVAELQSVDISQVEAVGQITGLTNQLAQDEVREGSIPREKLLVNAPAQEKGYIKVKSIFGRAT